MKSSKSPKISLPEGITKLDITQPKWDEKDRTVSTLGSWGTITMHDTKAFGWCIATLPISKSRVAGMVDRTYGIRVIDGQSVRVGAGPHVTSTITVYLRYSRIEALQKFIDLYNSGTQRANEIRDRISTRRANTAMRRNPFGWL